LLAGALFVGAHADSLRLPLIDFTPFSRAEKPVEVKAAQWVVRAQTSSGSASSAQDASGASARQVSASGGEGHIDWLDEPEDRSDVVGETLNMLELPSLDMAMGAAGPLSAAQLTSWPHRGMMGGSGVAGGADAGASMGASRAQTAQKDAAASGTDPAAEDNRLQPLLDTTVLNGPIPEPTTWATVILGLGLAGVALRNFKRRGAA
jgi:hypothetical protein